MSYEIHVNMRKPRWIDRISTTQYLVLIAACVTLPTVTAFGLNRTYNHWRRYRDAKNRAKQGRIFLKAVSTFHPRWLPGLFAKNPPGLPAVSYINNMPRTRFPDVTNYTAIGKGCNEHNWRSNDFAGIQRSLQRVDGMTDRELYNFTTFYTLLSFDRYALENVEKIMKWVVKGEANIDDVRRGVLPEYSKYDLPDDLLRQYESEGWRTQYMEPEKLKAYLARYEEAEAEFRRRGGKGLFKFQLQLPKEEDYSTPHRSPPTGQKRDV